LERIFHRGLFVGKNIPKRTLSDKIHAYSYVFGKNIFFTEALSNKTLHTGLVPTI